MRLARVDEALEACEKRLNCTNSSGTQIESLLTYSLLVMMYAEFEQVVGGAIRDKCATIQNESAGAFVESFAHYGYGRIRSSDMADFLSRFGSKYKEGFNSKANANPRAVTFYNNIITNRHIVAHSSEQVVTFLNVKDYYQEGHVVLDFFRETLLDLDAD